MKHSIYTDKDQKNTHLLRVKLKYGDSVVVCFFIVMLNAMTKSNLERKELILLTLVGNK